MKEQYNQDVGRGQGVSCPQNVLTPYIPLHMGQFSQLPG